MSTTDNLIPEPPKASVPTPAPAPVLPEVGPFDASALYAQARPAEIVSRGILFSLAAVPLGMAVAVLVWQLGFVASISSFVIAAAAAALYSKGATTAPNRGLVPLVLVVLGGVVLSFFAVVTADLVDFYNTPQGQSLGYPSVVDFVSANLFTGNVLSGYGSQAVMFVLFAALGVFGTVRRLVRARPA
jgi:hypothetical protein